MSISQAAEAGSEIDWQRALAGRQREQSFDGFGLGDQTLVFSRAAGSSAGDAVACRVEENFAWRYEYGAREDFTGSISRTYHPADNAALVSRYGPLATLLPAGF